jgi:hypothetical protein
VSGSGRVERLIQTSAGQAVLNLHASYPTGLGLSVNATQFGPDGWEDQRTPLSESFRALSASTSSTVRSTSRSLGHHREIAPAREHLSVRKQRVAAPAASDAGDSDPKSTAAGQALSTVRNRCSHGRCDRRRSGHARLMRCRTVARRHGGTFLRATRLLFRWPKQRPRSRI